MSTTEILLVLVVIILIALVFLLYLNLKSKTVERPDIYSKINEISDITKGIADTLATKIGEIAVYTSDVRQMHKSIENMLTVPKERASFGEINLEAILSDQLSPGMFGIREKIVNGKIPDAYIKSTAGLICIDARFPLDNYQEMLKTDDIKDKEGFKKQFIKDIDTHLYEVAKSYIDPPKTAVFAFAYIPSEGIYYFLLENAYDLLKDYAKKGVQIVSPLTISQKIELIKTGVHAKKLSEDAERVRNDIIKITQKFKVVDDNWRILYDTHIRNMVKKAEEVDRAYKGIRDEFDKISALGDIEEDRK